MQASNPIVALLFGLLLLAVVTLAVAMIQEARKNCHWHAEITDWINCIIR